jgi:ATP-dependent Clp protease ATP-binding subunit ClpC
MSPRSCGTDLRPLHRPGQARHRPSQAQAKAHHHHYIGTEHILLGICRDPRGSRRAHRRGLRHQPGLTGSGPGATPAPAQQGGTRPAALHRRGEEVIELSARKARQLGHDQIGTGHLLLGLLIQGSGPAAEVLAEAGITWQRAERELLPLIAAGAHDETPQPADRP